MTMMNRVNRSWWAVVAAAVVTAGALQVSAQQQAPDPRVGLKAGLTDAGQAAKNMELLRNVPRPENFGNPMDGGLNFANSDLAFKGNTLFMGNFYGFNFYDIEDPRAVKLRASIPCPGGQGDLSVYGYLLFMSVEQGNGRIDCGTTGDWNGIAGNPIKFALGTLSMFYDMIFLVQHFCLYHENNKRVDALARAAQSELQSES